MAVVILEREDAVGEAGRGSFAARAWRWALGEKQVVSTLLVR